MLTKMERKILSSCNKYPHDVLDTSNIQKHCPHLTTFDIAECCTHLNEFGYFEFFSQDLNNEVRLLLNYRGRHYREISHLAIKEFMFKSLFVPILVSFITSLLLHCFF